MVDSLDHELLQVAARRMAVVSEIAAYKRQHHLRIRDPEREREILEDRCRRAEEMGLPRGEIESLFRVLLRASRDHQAALQAELPAESDVLTIAIIGGRGAMGRVLERMFGDLGHRVIVSDLETGMTPGEAAAVADVTVISVPIDVTERVIREVAHRVRPESLLMDVTSVKSDPVRVMLESTTASVLGTHPMFGPSVHSLQGQRVVLCRGRGDHWAEWASSMFSARGLVVVEATPDHHDRMMAAVQVLTHFQTQVHGLTLARLGQPLGESLRFTSPAYLMELYVAARHFAQSADLYGPIEMRNPATPHVTAVFREAAAEIAGILARGDREAFRVVFGEVRSFLGEFTSEALEQTSFLIDRLVERT
jgi:chorismate mutase/prephenate dehydrogenase